MLATGNPTRGRRARGLAGSLVAAACLFGGVGAVAPAAIPGVTQSAADASGGPTPVVAADLTQFAVNSPAMIQAELIAVKYWNSSPCGGNVDVVWSSLDPAINAASTWWNPVAAYGNAAANSQCRITLNQVQDFDWPMFCTVMVHEIGHLVGQQHSTDQSSVMYPVYVAPIPECRVPDNGAPSTASSSSAPVAQAATTKHTPVTGKHKAHSRHKTTKHRSTKKKHA